MDKWLKINSSVLLGGTQFDGGVTSENKDREPQD